MKKFITTALTLTFWFLTNNKMEAQIPTVNDLILNISKATEQQRHKDAQIFAAYGRVPYIPNKVDPTLSFELSKKKLSLYIRKFLLKRGKQPAYYNANSKIGFNSVKNVVVTDDYFQFTNREPKIAIDTIKIYYKDILNCPIIYFSPFKNNISCYTKVKEHEFGSTILEFPDVFYYIQQYYSIRFYKNELTAFKMEAERYHLLSEKPLMIEEQRKYFVQANSQAENGNYFQAIELYENGIKTNPFSHVSAYFNLGLIAAMAECYPYAIFCMKKYLLLLPEAEDTRDVQDKIYEWETLIPITK